MNAAERAELLGGGKIRRVLVKLAVPSIVSLAAVAVFNIIDAAFVARLGTPQLGAITVAFPIFAVVAGVGQTFGTGAASLISRLLGAGKKHQADRIASTAILSVLGIGLIVAGLGQLFLSDLLSLLGATDTILPHATVYARMLIVANVFTTLNITMTNMLRSEGNAFLAMTGVIVSTSSNIVLDPICIFLLDMGIRGAAVATLISQLFTFLLLASTYFRRQNHCHIKVKLFSFGRETMVKLIQLGAPMFLLQLLGSIALAVINIAAKPYGDAAVASVGLSFRVLILGMYIMYGMSLGLQPLVGFNYGGGRLDRVFESIKTTFRWTSTFGVVYAAVIVIGARMIVSLFSPDPEVIDVGTRILRAVTLLFPFFGLQVVVAILFQSLGMAVPAALIFVARQALFFLPAIVVLPRFFGLDGVIYSQPVADILTTILTVVLAIRLIRRLQREREPLALTNTTL